MTQPIAGWYPDPSNPNRQRYFDGTAWTEHYANAYAPAPFPTQIGKPVKPSGLNKKWLFGVGAAAVVIAIASGTNGSDKKDTATSARPNPASTTTAAKPSGPTVAPAGTAVRDGKFEFQVLGIERSASKEGVFNPEPAKGEFLIIRLRVTNVGDEARTFWASNQKLIINGNKYEASSSLSDEGFRQEINPGLSINTKVMFDVPPGAVPAIIICHDSALSGGAQLAL